MGTRTSVRGLMPAVAPGVALAAAVLAAGAAGTAGRGATVAAAGPALPEHYAWQTTWAPGSTGLRHPLDVSTAADGRVVVFDAEGERVVGLAADGRRLGVWTDPEPADDGMWEDDGPIAAVGTADGGLIVLRRPSRILPDGVRQLREIVRHDATGALRWGAGRLSPDVTLDPLHPDRTWSDRLALARGGDRVFVLDRGGPRVYAKAAESGAGLGSENLPPAETRRLVDAFDWYVDLDVLPDGRLALLNQARSELLLLRSGWSAPGAAATRRVALEGRPRRVAADAAGGVFVLDADGTVRKLAADGRLRARWDARGPAPTARTTVADIAVQADGAVLAADAHSGAIHRFVPDASGAPAADASGCRLAPGKTAAPNQVRLGAAVTVTLAVHGDCPRREGADIALVVARGSGDGAASDELDAAVPFARAFVQQADLGRHRIAVISHQLAFTPTVDAPLSADRTVLLDAVDALRPARDADLLGPRHRVYARAQAVLDGPGGRDEARKVIVALATPGQPGVSVMDALRTRALGTRVIALQGLPDAVVQRLRRQSTFWFDEAMLWPRFLASDWWDCHCAAGVTAEAAAEVHAAIAADAPVWRATALASTLVVTDRLPADMAYVEGSAVPPAGWEPATRTLTWRLAGVPLDGTTLAFRVVPTLAGHRPTNVDARAAYTDGLGVAGALVFPLPFVDVLAPTPTASPTAMRPPTATPTPFPTTTPFPTALPSPTATDRPTPIRHTAWLPIALLDRCVPEAARADIALVLDLSSSMREAAGPAPGATKLDAARRAAVVFLDLVRLDRGDQVAVIGFNSTARVIQALTGDRSALERSLATLDTAAQTRIDLGIAAGAQALDGPLHRPGHDRVMIVLTDGRANPVGPEAAVAEAATAKRHGIRIFTIGLGDDLDTEALARIADRPDHFFQTADADRLAAIYAAIARRIPCPATPLENGMR